jgi:hypothetical protein
MPPLILRAEYPRIRCVSSFHELVGTPFADGVNALCWPRTLPGDYAEVARLIDVDEGITALEAGELRELPLTEAGRLAVETMLADFACLGESGLDPQLNCVNGYPRDEEPGPVRTDVCSFHVDSAPVEADTWLCTYFGAPSEGLPNEQAVRRVDLSETRAELLRSFDGEDDAAFREFLSEHCYDLHYAALPEAKPFSFGVGHLWRIAVQWPDSPVPPCIHRAPDTAVGERRLMLIS